MGDESEAIRDWLQGEPAISYQRCPTCDNLWYFRRDFCPRCGHKKPAIYQASGRGTVEAVTVVVRAPSAELQRFAPYGLVLVKAEEGFRMMGRGEPSLAIGDPVVAQFVLFNRQLTPYFERAKS